MADEFIAKLRYVYKASYTTGAYVEEIVRGNGAYDPEFVVGGGQPQWWDQMSAIYQQYEAYATNIRVTFMQRSGGGGSAFLTTGVYPHVESATAPGLSVAMERDYGRHTNFGPNTGGPNVQTIKRYMTTSRMYGVPQEMAKYDFDYSAAVTAVPSNQWYYHIYAGTEDGITDVSVYITITVDYTIRFFARDDIGASFDSTFYLPRIRDKAYEEEACICHHTDFDQ
jgi:hypothetical protein